MDIKNQCAAMLSNYEVMKHLQNIKENNKSKKGQLATITYEALKHLEASSCANQAPGKIKKCMATLQPYNLTKSEKLMIINSPPTTELEIQLIVENSEDRLTETQVTEVLNAVSIHLVEAAISTE